ncbi:MAG TPA: DUF1287 domain-containing protein [Pyrinomonadaceae bacterium]|nr:DUF1287 domain-containing protein [Pyrinomonadaceae bacterium]
MRNRFQYTAAFLGLVLITSHACQRTARVDQQSENEAVTPSNAVQLQKPLPANAPAQLKQLIDGAIEQVGVTTGYDPSYVSLGYPGGDVAPETGVCSDVSESLPRSGLNGRTGF